MSLWHVVVETTTDNGTTAHYETVVLAHTERSARVLAARAINRVIDHHNAHSVQADQLDIHETGVVFAMAHRAWSPLINRKETTDVQW